MLFALRLLLGPVLLWQGRGVRRNILRMPEPEGLREGIAGDGPELSVLILGDSSAAGVGASTQDEALSGQLIERLAERHRVTWVVHAMTGWTTADAMDALPGLDGRQFHVAIISLGVNDVTTETGLSAWMGLYRSLLNRLTVDHGVSHFVLSGLPPMGRFPALPQPLRWYLGQQAIAHDKAMGRLAAERPCAVHLELDFSDMDDSAAAEDGFHPGPPIYARWADELDQVLQQMLGRAQGTAPAPRNMAQAARK